MTMASSDPPQNELHGEPEIQKGDPELRKIVVLSLISVCSVAVIGVVLLEDHLGSIELLAMTSPTGAALALARVAQWFFFAIGAGALLGAFWMGWLSVRILRSDRYPPAGARTIRDMRVLRGGPARFRAWLGLVFALLFLLAGLVVPKRAEQALGRVLSNVLELQPVGLED